MNINIKVNRFATIEETVRFNKVTYYTIQMEEEDSSLFLQFINNHENKYQEQLSLIRSWLSKIGKDIGAKERYFRVERFRGGDTRALPPPSKFINIECNLRLYCMRINDNIVILYNGALKTANTAQECDNVRPHFLLANKLSKAIDKAIEEGDIEIDFEDGRLLYDDTLNLEI